MTSDEERGRAGPSNNIGGGRLNGSAIELGLGLVGDVGFVVVIVRGGSERRGRSLRMSVPSLTGASNISAITMVKGSVSPALTERVLCCRDEDAVCAKGLCRRTFSEGRLQAILNGDLFSLAEGVGRGTGHSLSEIAVFRN